VDKQERLPDYFLDITSDVCPMTFVKTKLLVERMKPGEIAEIRLNSGEPLENVPRSLAELGHVVLATLPEGGAEGIHRLTVQKASAGRAS
jgi:TusA-related sulfurtransferase